MFVGRLVEVSSEVREEEGLRIELEMRGEATVVIVIFGEAKMRGKFKRMRRFEVEGSLVGQHGQVCRQG